MKKKLASALILVPLLFGLTACGGEVTESDLEKGIQDKADEEQPGAVEKVDCPGGLKAEKGATQTCTLTIGGEKVDVVAKVTSVDGNTVNYNIDLAKSTK